MITNPPSFFVLQQRQNLVRIFGTCTSKKPSHGLAAVCSKVVILLLSIRCLFTPFVGFCKSFMFCNALLYVHSNFAIILMGKRELIALLCLSSSCIVNVVWLFLTMSRVCLHFVIVVFPDHTHLLFLHVYLYLQLLSSKETCMKK